MQVSNTWPVVEYRVRFFDDTARLLDDETGASEATVSDTDGDTVFEAIRDGDGWGWLDSELYAYTPGIGGGHATMEDLITAVGEHLRLRFRHDEAD